MLTLFETNVGSHIWKMERKDSDYDIASVYIQDSKNMLLGKLPKGKQKQIENNDYTYYEIGNVIYNLLKGNVNYIWAIMSPIILQEHKSALQELREIVSLNLAKNCFHSINGLSTHNIYHFIEKGDRESLLYKKKLSVIGRTLRFGIGVLTWGKCLFDKTVIIEEKELWDLKNQLNEALKNSHLPDMPNSIPFENYLIKWRLYNLKREELIE